MFPALQRFTLKARFKRAFLNTGLHYALYLVTTVSKYKLISNSRKSLLIAPVSTFKIFVFLSFGFLLLI
ncbi:hypothetical protein Hanom_Chr15g01414861 [Helianthus anomalus]